MKKVFLLAFLIVLAVANVSAQQGDINYMTVEDSETAYDGGTTTLRLDPTTLDCEGVCSEEVVFEVCGYESGPESYSAQEGTYFHDLRVPTDAVCSTGDNTVTVTTLDGSYSARGTLHVNPLGDMAPHKGGYLHVGLNPDQSPLRVSHFFITEDIDVSGLISTNYNGAVWVSKHNPNNLVGKWDESVVLRDNLGKGPIEGDSLVGIVQDTSGFDQPIKDVLEEPFGSATYNYAHPWGPDSMTPVHANGDYEMDNQLFRGTEPEHYDDSGNNIRGGSYWFVCREGATMPNGYGGETSQVVATDNQLYKCDLQGDGEAWRDDTRYDWEPVTECEDGLDNDNNGEIDLDDEGCEGNPLTFSEDAGGSQECEPIVGVSSDGQKKAYYEPVSSTSDGNSPLSTDCVYNGVDTVPDYTNQPPVQFVCTSFGPDNTQVDVQNYEGPTPDAAEVYCSNRLSAISSSAETIVVAQYFVPKQAMQLGYRWAGTDGFRSNFVFQTLHQAEFEYNEGDIHAPSQWYGTKQMTNDGHYDGSVDHTEYVKEWGVANASGANNPDINYPGGTLASNDVFQGGFYGECSEDTQWTETGGDWRCDIGSAERQTITVNTYRLGGDLGGKLAGFQINWSEMQDWEKAHPGLAPEGNGNSVEPVRVDAQCWLGVNRPSDLSKVVNISEPVQEGQDTYAVGALPDRQFEGQDRSDTYTCVFGLKQALKDMQNNPVTTSSQTDLFHEGKRWEDTTSDTAWVTEGTDENGLVQTDSGLIRPIDSPDVSEQSMQEWLSGKEANTDVAGQMFNNFRGEGDLSTTLPGGNICQQLRNPMDYYTNACSGSN